MSGKIRLGGRKALGTSYKIKGLKKGLETGYQADLLGLRLAKNQAQ